MKFFSSITALAMTLFSLQTFSAPNNKPLLRTSNVLNNAGKPVGQVTMKETMDGVILSLNLKGVPAGTHGMHIHQVGKCEGPDFKSAGDHLNPEGTQHGLHNPQGPHLGDLPNLQIPLDGIVKKEIKLKGFSLYPESAQSLASETGSALVIHAKADDNKTSPAGNSGDRIFCAVLAEPQAARR